MRILYIITTFLFFLSYSNDSYGQYEQDIQIIIKGHLKTIHSHFFNNSPEGIFPYTHPNLTAYYGGKEQMIAQIQERISNMKKAKLIVKNIEIVDPIKVVTYQDEFHCLVTEKTTISFLHRDFELTNHMLGISKDGGRKWVFIEANLLRGEERKKYFPNLKTSIEIPNSSYKQLFDPQVRKEPLLLE